MQRGADKTIGRGNLLALEYALTNAHQRLGFRADVLAQRQNQLCRQGRWLNRHAI